MKHIARTVLETYYQWYGDDTYYFNVLKKVFDLVGQVRVLYPGSFSHITPSFLFSHVTYVDSIDDQLEDFFSSKDLRNFITERKRYDDPTGIYFLNSYLEEDASLTQSFGLLISLSASSTTKMYVSYLKVGGWVLVSNSDKSASELSKDKHFRLVKEIESEDESGDVVVRDAEAVEHREKLYLFQKLGDSQQKVPVEDLFPCVRVERRAGHVIAGVGFFGDPYGSGKEIFSPGSRNPEQVNESEHLNASESAYSKILRKFHMLRNTQDASFQPELEFFQVEVFDKEFFENGMITLFLGAPVQEEAELDTPIMSMTIPEDEFAVFSLTADRFRGEWVENIMAYLNVRMWDTGSYWITHFLPQYYIVPTNEQEVVVEILVPILR